MSTLTIAAWQAEGHAADVEANTDAVRAAARWAKEMESDLLITPEMYLSGYNIPAERMREVAASADFPALVGGIAAEVGIAIVAGVPTSTPAGVYNSSIIVSATGEVLARHDKHMLFGDLDRELFLRGSEPFAAAEIGGVTVGTMICYDVEFPESVRAARAAGVELLAVPTANMTGYETVNEHVIPSRAMENGMYVAYVNRVGVERTGPAGELVYMGQSSVCSPFGERIAGLTGADSDQMLFATIDTEAVTRARSENPYWEDLHEVQG
ncbi:nitrilase-related carbon-nitrogen hydrolase [Brevibacterium litoralis]|uniref:nitrilase-related carbon-nitrogen hydrolase n=1 Tax=Brevibacterium litoralis TaxID=3138935 RepID=UPI0032EAC77F